MRIYTGEAAQWTTDRRVGRGGQARVYEASAGEGGEFCALKLVRDPGDQKRARFVRELTQHLRLVQSGAPHIVPIIDHNLAAFSNGGREGFYVMPLAPTTLEISKALFAGRVELSLETFEKILIGIREAHNSGIIHRDLKPANILFLDEAVRNPVIADFGICFVKGEQRLTQDGETVGARFFMAPEQERGGRVDVDIRADIYSLGKLLHHMLSGRELWREEVDGAFTDAELASDGRIAKIRDSILRHTIALNPDDRLPTVNHLLEAVRAIRGPGTSGGAPAIRPDPDAQDLARAVKENGAACIAEPDLQSAFRGTLGLFESDRSNAIRRQFDDLQSVVMAEWDVLHREIERVPAAAPHAAARLIERCSAPAGIMLACCRVNRVEVLDEAKGFIEWVSRCSQGAPGYVAVNSVPHALAGFLYMLCCVGSLRWRSWASLDYWLNAKFEWVYHSGRAFYSYGYAVPHFFHSEAMGRRADKVHDLFRAILKTEPYQQVLGLQADEVLNVYVQTQMLHCLRGAQDAERQNADFMWADFGRFYEFRVMPLIDRIAHDPEFANGVCSAFRESPSEWLEKLNARLDFVRSHFWGNASSYHWDSVHNYEARSA